MPISPYFTPTAGGDAVFAVEAPRIKLGAGALAELGPEARALGLRRVALFVDPTVARLEPLERARRSLAAAGVDAAVYDAIAVEPTDAAFEAAIAFARDGRFDGYVSLGGGSTIDTAKAANLYASHPADLMAYVNAPIGRAEPVPGPLRPHIACPTTFGTASECTGIAIFDLVAEEMKTGISHGRLRPTLGLLDPLSLVTLPAPVVAANAFDVFSHAVESLTARPFTRRPAPVDPTQRPLSQGANPYSDLACREAIRLVGATIEAAVADPADLAAVEKLMFAGMLAGIGFGNAGVHVPHAMSYAVAGLVRDYRPSGWPDDHAMVPHGISVIVNAPACFRRLASRCPERHLLAAEALGADTRNQPPERGGELLAERVIALMRSTGMPNGIGDVGYGAGDLDALADRAHQQQRLVQNAPGPVSREDLRALFADAVAYW